MRFVLRLGIRAFRLDCWECLFSSSFFPPGVKFGFVAEE